MKKIYFKDGNFTVVDDDFSITEGSVCKTSHGYAVLKKCLYRKPGKKHYVYSHIYLHRLIVNAPDGYEVDHINRNRLDNRKENLRICSRAENSRNFCRKQDKSSKFKGVHRSPNGNWIAQITFERKCYHIGIFSSEEEAAKAYDKKALELFGDFAWVNFPSLRT